MELILRELIVVDRYLRVIIDCELKWKEHIEYIYKKNSLSIVVYFISYEIYYPVLA